MGFFDKINNVVIVSVNKQIAWRRDRKFVCIVVSIRNTVACA